ncbi:MAG: hypothetical protein K8S13_01750 [Desulfobacula sp.]|uniref:hypothetical protein n=1 Tax=Desulfobacula sp. TaxID=2593537 RepID=UPI0025BE89A3|nr:hypothetical protein [Desulfobacula sp.]MCD4718572.1 hypothetical protein [Desulfobacula sp.]
MKKSITLFIGSIICLFLIFPSYCLCGKSAGAKDGTLSIKQVTPRPFTILEKGNIVMFSGSISYSLNNATTGFISINLSPIPVDSDGRTNQIVIENIKINQANGIINFSKPVKIERSPSDEITRLDALKVRAVLYHPNYKSSSIIRDTAIYPVDDGNPYNR